MLTIEVNGNKITLSARQRWTLYLVIGIFFAAVCVGAVGLGALIAYATM